MLARNSKGYCEYSINAGFTSSRTYQLARYSLQSTNLERTVNKKIDGVVKPIEIGALSAQTKVYYLKDCRQFCRWALLDRRAMSNPLDHLRLQKINKSQRKNRRALEPSEIEDLLRVTECSKERFGMLGSERSLLYIFASLTGLRASEIRSIKVGSLDLEKRTVMVDSMDTKNGQEAFLPLKLDLCVALESFVSSKHPDTSLFSLPSKYSMAKMIRADLRDAGIAPADNGNGKLDFHAQRHTFGILLAASGVHPKTAQDLMRHSDINLTMSRYTHPLVNQGARAVESLPSLLAKGML